MLTTKNCLLIVVDVQEKLVSVMERKADLIRNLTGFIRGIQILKIPIIFTEQAPEKIGKTIFEVASLLNGTEPMTKTTFSCLGSGEFAARLKSLKRKNILLAGIEAHVCVYQTAMDLVEKGFNVQVVADAVSSRLEANKKLGLERIKEVGAHLTGVEIVLCELLRDTKNPQFKQILGLIK